MIEAAVVLCKCPSVHKTYGVRFEKKDGIWFYTWAFIIRESAAKKEGYDKSTIKGRIVATEDYPGCPYCGSKSFVVCGCGKLNCYNGQVGTFTCDWCKTTALLSDYDGRGFTSREDI